MGVVPRPPATAMRPPMPRSDIVRPVPPPNIVMKEGSYCPPPRPSLEIDPLVTLEGFTWKLRPLDDTAARFAAIPWFIVWLLTLGAFGKPLFCASGTKLPTRAPDPSMKPPAPPAPPPRCGMCPSMPPMPPTADVGGSAAGRVS